MPRRRIVTPKEIIGTAVVEKLHVQRRQRVYKDQLLLTLRYQNQPLNIHAPAHGFVTTFAVDEEQAVTALELLLIMDAMSANDYSPAEQEVNPNTELGQHGRRALERGILQAYGEFTAPLFEAPQAGQPGPGLPQHPLLSQMKEGVPPKMSADAAHNDPAIERTIENASHDPELQKQLGAQLQQQLHIQPTISPTAPSLVRK